MTRTLPLTKAREELPKLVNAAKNSLAEFVITVNGVPAAVIMSHDEYKSWRETNEILSDSSFMLALKKGEKDIKEGKVHDWKEVKKDLGIDVQD